MLRSNKPFERDRRKRASPARCTPVRACHLQGGSPCRS